METNRMGGFSECIRRSGLLFISVFFYCLGTSHAYAARSLPPGTVPKEVRAEAKGAFSFGNAFSGNGTLTFTNTGGEARLTTVCDMSTVDSASGETCQGIDLQGSFSGGPDGTATFRTETGAEVKLQLKDGKTFTFAAQGITMEFTVTDPSVFNAWVENVGGKDSGARVSDLDGQVEIACPPDLDAWDVMKMGRVIYVDCHLKTGENSTAVISFSDMTTFEMRPESEIVIDTPPEKESKWSLLVGNVWVNVKQMVKDGTMKVHMGQAVAGIKGTTFVVDERNDVSTLKVMEGSVEFTDKAGNTSITVNTGEMAAADKNGMRPKQAFDVQTERTTPGKTQVPETSAPSGPVPAIVYPVAAGVVIASLFAGWLMLRRRKRERSSS